MNGTIATSPARDRSSPGADRLSGLDRVLRPRSVAFVGASASPVKVGGRRWLTLAGGGFAGSLYPIHPTADEVAGVPALRSVLDVPGPVDLVVIAIRPDRVQAVVEDCAEREVGGVIVITGGFGEHSDEGRALEQALVARLNSIGARMIGPNCAGIFSAAGRVNVTGMTIPPGAIGLITQSGNVLLDVAHRARRSGIGLSHAISMGNAVDLRAPELLAFMLADPGTKAILVYLEGWREHEARRFCDIVRSSGRSKPVIILKPGETDAGRRAVMSHTGSLAGEVRVAEGAFEQAGIIKASSLDEAWELAQALSCMPPLRASTVAVASDGGGHATLACDALEALGLTVPVFSDQLKQSLLAALPERCPVSNPVDYAGHAEEEPAVVAETLDLCLADPGIGAVLLAGHFGGYHRLAGAAVAQAERTAAERIGAIMHARRKPIVLHSVYADDPEPAVVAMRRRGVPVVRTLPEAAALLRGLNRWARIEARMDGLPERSGTGTRSSVADILARAEGGGALLEPDARELLARYGLPVPPCRVVRTPEDCIAAAESFDRPVALKVVSRAIVHKSDVGGVLLNVGANAAADGFRRLRDVAVKAGDPEGAVLVTPMAAAGIELVLGAFRDPHFGPVVMMGLGGVLVEVLGDVVFRMAPVTGVEARDMIGGLRAQRTIDGYRGRAPVDRDRLADAIVRLSHLVADEPQITEIDINPVIASGASLEIVDARVIVQR